MSGQITKWHFYCLSWYMTFNMISGFQVALVGDWKSVAPDHSPNFWWWVDPNITPRSKNIKDLHTKIGPKKHQRIYCPEATESAKVQKVEEVQNVFGINPSSVPRFQAYTCNFILLCKIQHTIVQLIKQFHIWEYEREHLMCNIITASNITATPRTDTFLLEKL